jgi:type IV secretory pathway component VirB8
MLCGVCKDNIEIEDKRRKIKQRISSCYKAISNLNKKISSGDPQKPIETLEKEKIILSNLIIELKKQKEELNLLFVTCFRSCRNGGF